VAVKYLGMPNVIANREVVPEFIQHGAQPRAIAQAVLRLLNDKNARDQMVSEFDTIIASLGEGGASERAANTILAELGTL
jgi:lipid-A-disaccharide synthase